MVMVLTAGALMEVLFNNSECNGFGCPGVGK